MWSPNFGNKCSSSWNFWHLFCYTISTSATKYSAKLWIPTLLLLNSVAHYMPVIHYSYHTHWYQYCENVSSSLKPTAPSYTSTNMLIHRTTEYSWLLIIRNKRNSRYQVASQYTPIRQAFLKVYPIRTHIINADISVDNSRQTWGAGNDCVRCHSCWF